MAKENQNDSNGSENNDQNDDQKNQNQNGSDESSNGNNANNNADQKNSGDEDSKNNSKSSNKQNSDDPKGKESDESTDPKLAKDFDALKGVVSGQQKKINEQAQELKTLKVKEVILESEYPDFIKEDLKTRAGTLDIDDIKNEGDRMLAIFNKGKEAGQGSVNNLKNKRPDKSDDSQSDLDEETRKKIENAKNPAELKRILKEVDGN